MANRRFIDFPIASTVGDSDIILIWQSGANKQTTKATFLSGLPENLDELNDVTISGLTNGQILRYDSVTGKWENTDQGNLDLNDLNDVSIVSPSNGQVLVYNSSTSKWENSSGGYVPYTGAVTTVNLGAQTIQAGQFVKAGGTSSQFLKADGSVDSNVYGTGTVTSVALTMPSAFSVANSPVTTAGTLAVTGSGTVGQYIRGDGSLADFPQASGGGSSVSYYLNGSISQGTIGGVAYKELNKVPILGAGTDFTINANGYIASFLTDAGDPNLLEIPGGNWNFETYFSASSGGGSPSFYVELYKYDGTTFTLIASSSSSPELIAFGTNLNPYFSTLAVPTTTLALTDRLAVRFYVTHSGRTITLHTENNHLCQVVTTFTTGLTSLNGLTAQVQNLAVGTSGTDFNIASATATHTFNLPTASATNRGALSSADWTTFNNKQNALGYVPVPETRTITINGTSQDLSANRTYNVGTVTSVGLSSATSGVTIGGSPVTGVGAFTLAIATASGSQNGLLSSTDWTTFNSKQNTLTNPVTGTGTTNYLPKFTGASTIGNSLVFDDGTNVGIGTITPGSKFDVTNTVGTAYDASNTLVSGQTMRIANLSTSSSIASTLLFIATGGGGGNGLGTISGVNTATGSLALTFGTRDSGGSVTERARITSGGNLLVGTTTDNGARLQVSGASTFSSSVTANGIMSLSDDGTYGSTYKTLGFTGNSNGSHRIFAGTADNIYIAAATARGIEFWTNGVAATRMIINSSGNVGIGTTSPLSKFHVNTGTNQNFRVRPGTDVGATNGIALNSRTDDDGSLQQLTLRASDVIMLTSGNVGIGTSSPTHKLQILGGSDSGLRITDSSGNTRILLNPSGAQHGEFALYNSSGNVTTYLGGSGSGSNYVMAQGGNFLIGTTTDNGARLQVSGTANFVSTINPLILRSTNATTMWTEYYYNTSTLSGYIGNGSGILSGANASDFIIRSEADLVFTSGGNNRRLTISSTGAATFSSSVRADAAIVSMQFNPASDAIIAAHNSVNVGMEMRYFPNNAQGFIDNTYPVTAGQVFGDIYFRQNVSGTMLSRMMIQARSGNVGIGTTSPSTKLNLYNATTQTQLIITGGDTSNQRLEVTDGTVTNRFGIFGRTNGDAGVLGTMTNHPLMFIINDTERMRITSVGRGLFGTQTASAGANGFAANSFQVKDEIVSIGSTAGIFWENRSGGVTASSNWYGWYTTGGVIYLYNGAANIASINTSTGAYTALSDINKKENFEASEIGLKEVLNLKPTIYSIKNDAKKERHLGFIAQEVKQYIPNAYVESDGFIGLNEMPIIAALTKAIQELKQEIDTLKN